MKKLAKLTIAFMALVFVFSMPAAAATNKGIRVYMKPLGFAPGTDLPDYLWARNSYCIYTALPTASKTTLLKTNTYGGRLYIPKAFLSANGSEVSFSVAAWFSNKSGYVGVISGRQTYKVGKKNGKIVTSYFDGADNKDHSGSGALSVKLSGNYYIVTFKNLKSLSTYYKDENNTNVPVNTKTSYNIELAMDIHIDVPKTVKGYVYLDYISINAAKKFTVKFDTKDYSKVSAVLDDHELYAPVVKIGS